MQQNDFIAAVVDVLQMSRRELAEAVEVQPRSFYNWTVSLDSKEHRDMPEKARCKLYELLEAARADRKLGDWLAGAKSSVKHIDDRDHVRLDWNLLDALVRHFVNTETRALQLYALPIATWLSEPSPSPQLGKALKGAAEELKAISARSEIFGSEKDATAALKKLPAPHGALGGQYADIPDLLRRFKQRLAEVDLDHGRAAEPSEV